MTEEEKESALITQSYPTVDNNQYGELLRPSKVCNVCNREDRVAIHAARGRDHKTLKEISEEFGVSRTDLTRHFANHYLLTSANQEIINIVENTDSVLNDVTTQIFEGSTDLVKSSSALLRSYAKNLKVVQTRIDVLSAELERDMLELDELTEFQNLQKIALDIGKNMQKSLSIVDKKLFPKDSDDLFNSILHYKLDVLKRFLDTILVVFSEFENRSPSYSVMIQEMRNVLRLKFNSLEEEVLESGGVLNPNKGE